MAFGRVTQIIANFERGALTESSVCAELIDLAGAAGADEVVRALPPELRSLLKRHSLVADPPASPRDVMVTESYGGPDGSPEERERLERSRRENAHRGVWALHRALYGGQ